MLGVCALLVWLPGATMSHAKDKSVPYKSLRFFRHLKCDYSTTYII